MAHRVPMTYYCADSLGRKMRTGKMIAGREKKDKKKKKKRVKTKSINAHITSSVVERERTI